MDDAELVRRWADGDAASGAALVQRHGDQLYRFLSGKLPGEVDDLIHDVFVTCLERRAELPRWRSFRAYLLVIARHRLYARIRERMRNERFDPGVSRLADLVSRGVSSRAAGAQLADRVRDAMTRLPLQLQVALELRFWEGLTGPELAEALEVPEGTVRSRLRRGLEALRRELGPDPDHLLGG